MVIRIFIIFAVLAGLWHAIAPSKWKIWFDSKLTHYHNRIRYKGHCGQYLKVTGRSDDNKHCAECGSDRAN